MAKNQEFRDPQQASPAADKPAVYVVAPGKTITTLRGPADAGKQLTPRDFVRGQAVIDELVASGDVLKT